MDAVEAREAESSTRTGRHLVNDCPYLGLDLGPDRESMGTGNQFSCLALSFLMAL